MMYLTVLLTTVALLAAGCGSDTTETAARAAGATTTPPSTTTVAQPTAAPTSDGGVIVVKDVPYLELDGSEYLIDVYIPSGEGPWPVVVAFHGATVFKNHPMNTVVARATAEAGMAVFAPSWEVEWPGGLGGLSIGVEEMERWEAAVRCAVAFAQQEAATYGGDSNRTIIYGVSAGASVSYGLVLNPPTELAPGCLAQALPVAPIGAVLGDAEYFYHSTFFDEGFKADAEGIRARGADVLDPATWPANLSARFHLWAAESDSLSRPLGDPWDEDGWFAQRDAAGTIRQDLDELGGFDDGTISHRDEGLLLATRLERAGIDATFDLYPGGHTPTDKVPELVAYLVDLAGTS